jgi:hypothetical protein
MQTIKLQWQKLGRKTDATFDRLWKIRSLRSGAFVSLESLTSISAESLAFAAATLALRIPCTCTKASADAGITTATAMEKTRRCKKQMETADYLTQR